MSFGDVNLWAVLLAAVVKMGLGAFWYSPNAFGKLWMQATGRGEEDCRASIWQYGVMFLQALAMAWVISLLVHWMHLQNIAQGVALGFFLWLGLIATTQLSAVLWAKQSMQVYLINVSYLLFSIVVMTSILTLWQ